MVDVLVIADVDGTEYLLDFAAIDSADPGFIWEAVDLG
jgi:hypothetical protein